MHMDWQDAEADTVLLVRAEAAGMVTGKQGMDPDKLLHNQEYE